MATAPKDGTFIRVLTKGGNELVAFYHRTAVGWKDWQSRGQVTYQADQCHGWHPVNQQAARALPLYLPLYPLSESRAKERHLLAGNRETQKQ